MNSLTHGRKMENVKWWMVLLGLAPLCSFAGLAALLRSRQKPTYRAIASAMLNSGLFGVAIGAGMLWKFGTESFLLIIFVSTLAGLGGNAALDFGVELFMSWIRSKADK